MIDSLFRSYTEHQRFLRKIARFLGNRISPNSLSILSLLFALASGLLFVISKSSDQFNYILFFAAILLALSSILDMLDGMVARESKKATARGDFLEHVIDRYSDIFVLLGIIFGGYVGCSLGIVAVAGVLLTSYIGVQAQAIGLKRIYGGILGRADRLLLIIFASFLNSFYSRPIFGNLTILGIAILVIAILSHLTALQRIYYVLKQI